MCEREEGGLGEKTERRRRRTTTKTAKMEVKMLFLARGQQMGGNCGEGSVRRAARGGHAAVGVFFVVFFFLHRVRRSKHSA